MYFVQQVKLIISRALSPLFSIYCKVHTVRVFNSWTNAIYTFYFNQTTFRSMLATLLSNTVDSTITHSTHPIHSLIHTRKAVNPNNLEYPTAEIKGCNRSYSTTKQTTRMKVNFVASSTSVAFKTTTLQHWWSWTKQHERKSLNPNQPRLPNYPHFKYESYDTINPSNQKRKKEKHVRVS